MTPAGGGGIVPPAMSDANTDEKEVRRSPLHEVHEELGGKMVPFAGWLMPVQYSSIMDEHAAVREACGVFDISHMGQFRVAGKGAGEWLNEMLANNTERLGPGEGQYTFLLNEGGGVIDDLILYREAEESFFLVVNAAKAAEDWAWLEGRRPEGVAMDDHSEAMAGMAVQGPKSPEVFHRVTGGRTLPPRNGIDVLDHEGQEVVVCRTGYTGEDGFEFFCPAERGGEWLRAMVAAGAKPCGLGARDSLRLEMCYPLNGADLSPGRTPLEAGLGFFVDMEKGGFTGRERLAEQKENGLAERLAAIRYTGPGAPPRAGYAVCLPGGEKVGELTSGVLSPSLRAGIGMAYLPAALAKPGTALEVEVRGRRFPAKVVKKPFYRKG